jgi:hypothetical protein
MQHDEEPELAIPTTPQSGKTKALQTSFLLAYAVHGNVTAAAAASRVSTPTVYRWLNLDVLDFRARLDYAREQHADSLEELMHERLSDPAGNRGSDILLIFALKAARRAKYSDGGAQDDSTARELIRELRALKRRRRLEAPVLDVEHQADGDGADGLRRSED